MVFIGFVCLGLIFVDFSMIFAAFVGFVGFRNLLPGPQANLGQSSGEWLH